MGGLKKAKVASTQTGQEKGKEIKIVSRSVVTVADIMKNQRALKLLYLISLATNGISEKALAHLVYSMEKDSNVKLGYNFVVIGDTPVSKELTNELTTLKYTGLVEVSLKNKKLYITGQGKEVLDKAASIIQDSIDGLRKVFEEIWPKIAPVDVEASLKAVKR
ncbi:MAG: hypothetical protein QXS24_05985 [Desulfurococcaceae archaeon]